MIEMAIDDPECRLMRLFGSRGTQEILQSMKDGKMEDIFGSSAEVIRQIAWGIYPSVKEPLRSLPKAKIRYFLEDLR